VLGFGAGFLLTAPSIGSANGFDAASKFGLPFLLGGGFFALLAAFGSFTRLRPLLCAVSVGLFSGVAGVGAFLILWSVAAT
jgi:hypothetical protein